MDLTRSSALDLLGLLDKKEIKPREVVDAHLKNIAADRAVNAYVSVLDREAELSPDGLTLTLRIAPMTAAMRQKLASGATSG